MPDKGILNSNSNIVLVAVDKQGFIGLGLSAPLLTIILIIIIIIMNATANSKKLG